MSNNIEPISVDNVGSVLAEIDAAFFDIPFENSEFQTMAFVIAAQQTPGRAYRAIGLRMHAKIRAVKEYIFSQEKTAIDIEEKQYKMSLDTTSEFDRRRLRLEVAQLNDGAEWGRKLLTDALRELDVLYREFKKYPVYSRSQFEAEEAMHFDMKLTRALTAQGAMESLLNMREDLPSMDVKARHAKIACAGGDELCLTNKTNQV